MANKNTEKVKAARLRRKAEKLMGQKQTRDTRLASADKDNLIHELEVHQIELELQNEELREAQRKLQISHDRYESLFEFAPVGYLILDKHFIVKDANLTGTAMLDIDHNDLIGKKLSQFVKPKYEGVFFKCLKSLDNCEESTCELKMKKWRSGNTYFARLNFKKQQEDRDSRYKLTLTDITELKKEEEALKASQRDAQEQANRFQTAIDTTPAFICIALDPECRNISGNFASCELVRVPKGIDLSKTGPAAEMLSHYRVFKDSKELAPEEMPIQRVAATGKALRDYIIDFRFEDGTVRSLIGNVTPLFDEEGKPGGAVAAFVDITDLKKAEEQLIIKDYALASSLAGIGITDLEGNLDYVNRALVELGGYSEDEVIGKSVYQFFEDEKVVASAFKTVIESGSWQGDLKARRKDGTIFEVHALANRVNDDKGNPICLMASLIDITERKEAEQELNSREERFRLLVENIQSGVALIDEEGQFVTYNPSFLKMFGLSVESDIINVNSRDWSDWEVYAGDGKTLLHVDEHPVRKVVLTHQAVKERLVGVRLPSSGELIWMLINAAPLFKPDGSIQYILATFYDVTELKKAEQIKDDFIGMVSHELRTPLTIFMGAVQVARTEGIGEEERRELLQEAATSSESLSHILENLIELSRYQSDRLTLSKEKIDIGSLINNILRSETDHLNGHRLSLDITENLPNVEVDKVRLHQIVRNLLDNAAKYSPENTEIRVSARQKDENILIGVSDQGNGISPEDQEKLFAPFERLREDSTTKAGLGLGLLVCRRLVEAHGGKIWVESTPGQGTTFWFTLPIDSVQPE
jgi:PAS domain S-box-containing protein